MTFAYKWPVLFWNGVLLTKQSDSTTGVLKMSRIKGVFPNPTLSKENSTQKNQDKFYDGQIILKIWIYAFL